jgi:hypothetical protein
MLIVLLSIETLAPSMTESVSQSVEWQIWMNDDESMRQGFFIADYSSSNVASNIGQKGNINFEL